MPCRLSRPLAGEHLRRPSYEISARRASAASQSAFYAHRAWSRKCTAASFIASARQVDGREHQVSSRAHGGNAGWVEGRLSPVLEFPRDNFILDKKQSAAQNYTERISALIAFPCASRCSQLRNPWRNSTGMRGLGKADPAH